MTQGEFDEQHYEERVDPGGGGGGGSRNSQQPSGELCGFPANGASADPPAAFWISVSVVYGRKDSGCSTVCGVLNRGVQWYVWCSSLLTV